MAKYAAITGKYIYVTVEGIEYRVYFEEAGQEFQLFVSIPQVPMADNGDIY